MSVPKVETISSIKEILIIGIGSAGCRIMDTFYMHSSANNFAYLAIDTDEAKLGSLSLPEESKALIGNELTGGCDTGADPEAGFNAALSSYLTLFTKIKSFSPKLVILISGLGGGTGSGAIAIVAELCDKLGCVVVAAVSLPFEFEAIVRATNANNALAELKKYVDTVIISDHSVGGNQEDLKSRFEKGDAVMSEVLTTTAILVTGKGHIIVDLEDVISVFSNEAKYGIACTLIASGDDRIGKIVLKFQQALKSNKIDLTTASLIVVNIDSCENSNECTMDELEQLNEFLRKTTNDGCDVIVGMGYDNLLAENIRVSMIFKSDNERVSNSLIDTEQLVLQFALNSGFVNESDKNVSDVFETETDGMFPKQSDMYLIIKEEETDLSRLSLVENENKIIIPAENDKIPAPSVSIEAYRQVARKFGLAVEITAFLMMDLKHESPFQQNIVKFIRQILSGYRIALITVPPKTFNYDNGPEKLNHLKGCDFGIAVVQQSDGKDNYFDWIYETGYMHALSKPVCIIKESNAFIPLLDFVPSFIGELNQSNVYNSLEKCIDLWLKKFVV